MFNYLKKSILILFFYATPLIAMELNNPPYKKEKMSESTLHLLVEIQKNDAMIEPLIKEDTDVNLALKYAIYILSSYDSPNNVGDNEKKLKIIQKLCKQKGLLTNIDEQNNNTFHAIIKKGIPAITALIIAPHLEPDDKVKKLPVSLVNAHIEKIFAILNNANTLEQKPLDLLSSDENYKNQVESLFEKLKNDHEDFKQNYPDRKSFKSKENLALKIHDAYFCNYSPPQLKRQ